MMTENKIHKVQATVSIDIDTEEFDQLVIENMKIQIRRTLANAREIYAIVDRGDVAYANTLLSEASCALSRLLGALSFYMIRREYSEYEMEIQREWKTVLENFPEYYRIVNKYYPQ